MQAWGSDPRNTGSIGSTFSGGSSLRPFTGSEQPISGWGSALSGVATELAAQNAPQQDPRFIPGAPTDASGSRSYTGAFPAETGPAFSDPAQNVAGWNMSTLMGPQQGGWEVQGSTSGSSGGFIYDAAGRPTTTSTSGYETAMRGDTNNANYSPLPAAPPPPITYNWSTDPNFGRDAGGGVGALLGETPANSSWGFDEPQHRRPAAAPATPINYNPIGFSAPVAQPGAPRNFISARGQN